MLKRVFVFAFLIAAVACSGPSNPTPASPSPTVTSVSITGNPSLNGGNLTSQLIARATLSDGTLQDVSTLAMWSSSNPLVSTASAIGLVTAVTLGTTTISAAYQGKTGTLSVSVLSLNMAAGLVGTCADISIAGAMGSVTAQVNGVATSFCLGSARQGNSAGEASIEAQSVTSPFFSLLMSLPGVFSRGTYTAGPAGHTFTAGMANATAGGSWSTTSSGGTGRLAVTTATASGASGTFSFTAVPGPGSPAPGTVVVTDGVFNITSWSR
jgi:hypothetical protein